MEKKKKKAKNEMFIFFSYSNSYLQLVSFIQWYLSYD